MSPTIATYATDGFLLTEWALTDRDLAPLRAEFLEHAERFIGRRPSSMHDPELAQILCADRPIEARLYDAAKAFASLRALGQHPSLVRAVDAIIGRPFGVFEKAVLRIDLPGVADEVTGWHQDHYFVRGNAEIVTLWLPLQDVNLTNGCLVIAPESHRLGPVDHPARLGKRDCLPDDAVAAFERRPAPMAAGQALLFHACLFHTGQINRSSVTRYSVQYRYTPLGLPTDPGMGAVLPIAPA